MALALSIVAPVMAASLEDAVAAHRRADCATAIQVYHSLADQGPTASIISTGVTDENGTVASMATCRYAVHATIKREEPGRRSTRSFKRRCSSDSARGTAPYET